jgi:hypothetical protein
LPPKLPFNRRRAAFVVARQARPAHIGPRRIDGTGGGNTDLPDQGRAAVAVAAHASALVIDEPERDAFQRSIVLQREARPLGGIGAACAACLAVQRCLESRLGIVRAFDRAGGHYRRALRAA